MTDKTQAYKAKVLQAAEHLTKAIERAHRGPWVAYGQDDEVHVTRPYCSGVSGCEADCGSTVVSVGKEGCEEDILTLDDAFYIAQMNPRIASWLVLMLKSYAEEVDLETSQSHPMTMYWLRQLVREINEEIDPDEVPQAVNGQPPVSSSETSDHNPQADQPATTYAQSLMPIALGPQGLVITNLAKDPSEKSDHSLPTFTYSSTVPLTIKWPPSHSK